MTRHARSAQWATHSPRQIACTGTDVPSHTSSMTAERRCKLGGRRRPVPEGPLRGTWLAACPLLVTSAPSSPDDPPRDSSGSGCAVGGRSAAVPPPPSPAAAAASGAGCAAELEAAAGTGGAAATGVPADCCCVTNGDRACKTARGVKHTVSGCAAVTPVFRRKQSGRWTGSWSVMHARVSC